MPAYGKNLSPAETTALVSFLVTLRPTGQAPARDASRDAVLAAVSGATSSKR
jgi:ubiquinol-cytochrome c reductase cytochrome b subunit